MKIKVKLILPSLVCLLVGMLFFFTIRTLPIPLSPELNNKFIMGLIACVCIFLLSTIALRYENISLSAMHLIPNNKTFLRLFIGLVIGAIITGMMLYALFTFTILDLNRVESQTIAPFLLASLVFIPLALMEELLFRGYPFFRLSQLINIRWVLLITAILFAFYHFNGKSSIVSLLLGPGVWGVTYGVAAYLSKSVAVPLGIHISANALLALFGLKQAYIPMWEVTKPSSIAATIEPDHLGVIMQIVLLIVSIMVLEFSILKKKSIHMRVANAQSKLTTNAVLGNK